MYEQKQKKMEFSDDILIKAKIAELGYLEKNLNQAKDDAMQSWLDSRPLIDELEKKQAELAAAKARLVKSNTAITEIQAQIGTTDMCIKASKEEELKLRMIINDKNQDLHRTQEEMEQIKLKIDQKRRKRSRLKQELRIRKHTLRTLELTYEAVRLESEAFGASEVQALRHISNSEAINAPVRLTQEEYDILKREAREQNSLAEWRISVSLEEKFAAEKRRDTAFMRLEKLHQRNVKEKTAGHEDTARRRFSRGVSSSSKAPAKFPAGVGEMKPEAESKNGKDRDLAKKKKSSFCVRIKKFFVRKLLKHFK